MAIERQNGCVDEQALRIFLSLAQTQNTRDTAALLQVNQSNVSRAIARLEAHLGLALFARHGKRLELNRNGVAFRADAAAVLDALELARRHADAIAAEARIVRIGFLHSTARWLVPDVVQRFRQLHPGERVTLRQGFARDLYGWLADDVLDLVLCTAPAAPLPDVTWHTLADEELCIAVPPGDPLAARTTASATDIAGREFIGFSRIAEMRTVVDEIFAVAGVTVRTAFESSEIDTMRALVAGGLGVSILPRTPGRDDPSGPVYVPLVPPRVRALGVAVRAGTVGADLALDLVSALRARD